MKSLAIGCVAISLAACAATHGVEADAGRAPILECDERGGSCRDRQCCTDPDTGDRYCCSGTHQVILDDGTITWMCGYAPACTDALCCAGYLQRFPDYTELCDTEYFCDGFVDIPPTLHSCDTDADCTVGVCCDNVSWTDSTLIGDRYCCDGDHQVTLDDGTSVWMCGDELACVDNFVCCADMAERYPDEIFACTTLPALCDALREMRVPLGR